MHDAAHTKPFGWQRIKHNLKIGENKMRETCTRNRDYSRDWIRGESLVLDTNNATCWVIACVVQHARSLVVTSDRATNCQWVTGAGELQAKTRLRCRLSIVADGWGQFQANGMTIYYRDACHSLSRRLAELIDIWETRLCGVRCRDGPLMFVQRKHISSFVCVVNWTPLAAYTWQQRSIQSTKTSLNYYITTKYKNW